MQGRAWGSTLSLQSQILFFFLQKIALHEEDHNSAHKPTTQEPNPWRSASETCALAATPIKLGPYRRCITGPRQAWGTRSGRCSYCDVFLREKGRTVFSFQDKVVSVLGGFCILVFFPDVSSTMWTRSTVCWKQSVMNMESPTRMLIVLQAKVRVFWNNLQITQIRIDCSLILEEYMTRGISHLNEWRINLKLYCIKCWCYLLMEI